MTEKFGRLFICVAILLFGHRQAGGARGGEGGQDHILQKEAFFFRKTFLREAIPQKIICFILEKRPNDLTPPCIFLNPLRVGGRETTQVPHPPSAPSRPAQIFVSQVHEQKYMKFYLVLC